MAASESSAAAESSAAGESSSLAPWVAGAAAGSVMTVVGHPFDTLKVRMQATPAAFDGSTWRCARETVRVEGVLAVYKGLQPALFTTCVTSGLRFGVQHTFNDFLVRLLRPSTPPKLLRRRSSAGAPTISPHRSFDELSAGVRIAAEGGGGAACGLVLPLVYTPMDLIKIRRQVLRDNSLTNWQIARSVYSEGGLAALYAGHWLTVARSTLGNAALFGSFEAWKALLRLPASPLHDRPWSTSITAGVLSGWTTQLITFPIDAAKSRVQAATTAEISLLPALRELWREGAMYRGVEATLLRCVPVHVAYLPVYGLLMDAHARRLALRGHS